MENKTLIQRLIDKKNAERLTVKEIAAKIEVPYERVAGWIKQGGNVKYDDGIKIENWIKTTERGALSYVKDDGVEYFKRPEETKKADEYWEEIKRLNKIIENQQKLIEKMQAANEKLIQK